MRRRTKAAIATRQKATGIEPATGERREILYQLSNACFDAIKIIELEKSGIRDGDGFWHGGDVIGGIMGDLKSLCDRLLNAYFDTPAPF